MNDLNNSKSSIDGTGDGVTKIQKPSWKFYPQAPQPSESAPNVLVVLTDDVGFGACSTFGGLIPTPALDRLAGRGLRYNAFHTTAMCSPTRAALLTGRNHHSVGFGAISNFSVDAPGYTSAFPRSVATVARILRDTGYDTAMFGKNHNTPEWELGPLGPFDRWPLGQGFNYFYGFNAGQTDQFVPALVENLNPVRPPLRPGYHLDEDLADKAINWFQVQKALRPDNPFFIYWAPGTLHEPHQAPASWLERFAGQFSEGWDALRTRVFAEQKRLGVIPPDAALTARPHYIPAWDTLTPDVQRLYSRQMEAAAAQLSHFDYQFGRVLSSLEERGQIDNTLVIFIQGDNGACQEYEFGNTNMDLFGVKKETTEDMMPKIDAIGGPGHHGTYAPGWAWTLNTPLAESKQIASHLGGIRNGLVVSWPSRITSCGEVRSQFAHVIDIAPTIFEAVGIQPPDEIEGVKQKPIEGISLVYTFDAPDAPEEHDEQYFEMLGNRGLYQRGWMASTLPPTPPFAEVSSASGNDPLAFDWALYHLKVDWSQSKDVSGEHPKHLSDLRARFGELAETYSLHPIANDQIERQYGDYRPSAASGHGPRLFPAGPTRYRGTAFPTVRPGWGAEASITLDRTGLNGSIFSMGSKFSGVELKVEQGHVVFVLNPTGDEKDKTVARSNSSLEPGESIVGIRITSSTPASILMTINGKQVEATPAGMFPMPTTPETFVGEYGIDSGGTLNDEGFSLRHVIIEDGSANT